MTRIAAAARRRGVPGPRSAVAALLRHHGLDAALATAWDTAGRSSRAQIVDLQLSRGTAAAAESLVAQLHTLEATARAVLLARIGDLHPTLRRILTRPALPSRTNPARVDEDQTTLNALWLVEQSNTGVLAYLVTPRLRDPDPAIRDAAVACLLSLANGRHQPATGTSSPPDHGHTTSALAESLDQAVAHYATHNNPGALKAWAAQGSAAFAPESPALAALSDPDHPAVPALRDLLKHADTPAIRRGLVGMLGLPTLALACVAGLRRLAETRPADLAHCLHGNAHLLSLPAVRRGLARGGSPERLWPPAFANGGAHVDCDALPAWAAALPGTPRDAIARLTPLTTTGPPTRRLDALRHTLECAPHHPATPATLRRVLVATLTPLARDADPQLAGPAAARLLREDLSPPRPPHRFRAPHRPDPGTAPRYTTTSAAFALLRHQRAHTRRVAATAFEPLWHSWTRLPADQRRSAAAAALRLDPTARVRLQHARTAHDQAVRSRGNDIINTASLPALGATAT